MMSHQSQKREPKKKQTIPKNLDRMAAAHAAVERLDKEMEEYRELQKRASFQRKRGIEKKNLESLSSS